MIPDRYALTDWQRRLITKLAKAELQAPPAWIRLNRRLRRQTMQKLCNMDLIVVSDSVDYRARITTRGLRFYEQRICQRQARYTDDDLRSIICMAMDEVKFDDIAEAIGCSHSYVRWVLRAETARVRHIFDSLGMKPKRFRRKSRYPAQVRQQALDMRRAGARYVDIQQTLDVPQATIAKWLHDEGLIRRRRLTHKQRQQIVDLALKGSTNQEIAAVMGRSAVTIRRVLATHYQREFQKGRSS